jgi:TolA-binding protein
MNVVSIFFCLSIAYVAGVLGYFRYDAKFLSKLDQAFHQEKLALKLANENRLLKVKNATLAGVIQQLEAKNYILSQSLESKKSKEEIITRKIASIPKVDSTDLVNYDVYKWTPQKLLAIGERELHFKNYEKSAQFYQELLTRFPKEAIISDRVLFGAGIAAFETKKRYDWAASHLKSLVTKYPKSSFYRGAKLWLALSQYNQGDSQQFLATVEEFRLKYRNTEEWKILSKYYEDINYNIKK